ncbi:MAG: SNF2 helicase associated domain-containing protein [Lentisphaeraceae bacterium]|nr:SNF2 helicase associated domain-containing protein [Lentisphaeraceae bacterium]
MSGTLCEHGVAAALAYRKAFTEKFDYCFTNPNGIDSSQGEWESGVTPAPAAAPAYDLTRSALKKRHLRDLLRGFEKQQGRLILRIAPNTLEENRWKKIVVKAEIHFEDKIYAASNMKKLLDLEVGAGGMKLENFPPQDQLLMRSLCAQATRQGNKYTFETQAGCGLFHSLTDFKDVYIGENRLRVNSHPVTLVLNVVQKDKGYEISPLLRVQEEGLISVKKCTLLAGINGYWLGVANEYFWLPGKVDVQWLEAFLSDEELFLKKDEFLLLRQACDKGLLPVEISIVSKSQELETIPCRPIMNLDWNNGVIQARIYFEYGEYVSVKSDSKTVWDGERFIMRDHQGEEDAYTWLCENDFEQHQGAENTFFVEEFKAISHFLLQILPELGHTWKIYYSETFSSTAKHIRPIQMKVTTSHENANWVELALDFQRDEESINEWQAIIHAAKENLELVRLKDGSLARLDEETRKTLRMMPELEKLNQGKYRFSRYMSLMMNQLLSGYLEEESSEWRQLQDKMLYAPQSPHNLSTELSETLRCYQSDGVAWLQAMKNSGLNCILADEMGLGKTIQALSMISSVKKASDEDLPTLIVCPKSLIDNWCNEAARFVPELKVLQISGGSRDQLLSEIQNYDVVVTSYALVRRDIKTYQDIEFDNLVLDEAQNIKNHRSQTAQSCRALNARFKAVLSGTPLENSLREIWSMFDFILPGLLGTVHDFRGKFEQQSESIEINKDAAKELSGRIRPFILRRLKCDLLEQLPPKQEQILYCEFNDEQKSIYSALARDAGSLVGENQLNKKRFAALALLMRLRQVCCHPTLVPGVKEERGEVNSAKFELLKELLYEILDSSHRVLIFSQFTSMLKIIAGWLKDEGVIFEYLDGSTTNRQEKVDRFNEDETIKIFLLSLKAGGTGLNLTGADTVIHYDMWWNPQVEDQATDRTHRIGQTKPVNVYKLVARDTIEDKVLKLQDKKRELFQNVMDGVPQKLGDLNEEDLRYLLSDEL